MRRITDLLSRRTKPNRRTLLLERLEDRSLLTAGLLDPTFGIGGKVTTDFPYLASPEDIATAVQWDGKLVVGGAVNNDGLGFKFEVSRYNADGSLDSSFGAGGRAVIDTGSNIVGAVAGMAIQPDGKIVMVGGSNVVRLNTDGTLDEDFGSDGIQAVSNSSPSAIALQPDGKIIVAGTAFVAGAGVQRLNSDGSHDNSFAMSGSDSVGFPAAVSVRSDGSILVLGRGQDFEVSCLTATGQLDTSFGNAGHQSIDFAPGFDDEGGEQFSVDFANSMDVAADGAVVITGNTDYTGLNLAVARLTPAGQLDSSFGFDGKQTINFGSSINQGSAVRLQSDGKILVAGMTVPNSKGDFAVARLTSAGQFDTTFGTAGKQVIDFGGDDTAAGLILGSDGKIVLVGTSYQAATGADFALARLNPNGSLDSTFDGDGKVLTDSGGYRLQNTAIVTDGVFLQPDGKVVVTGSSGKLGLAGNDFVAARYNVDGSLDQSFGDGGRAMVNIGGGPESPYSATLQPDGKILMVGRIDRDGTNADLAITRLNTDGTLDQTFGSGGKEALDLGGAQYFNYEEARAVSLQSDGKIIVAGLSSTGAFLARLNANGSLDGSFGTNGRQALGFDVVYGIAVQADNKIVAEGESFSSATRYDFSIVRTNSNGTLDTAFGMGGVRTIDFSSGNHINDDAPSGIALQSDGKIIVAGSTHVAGDSSPGKAALARLNIDGSFDTAFGTGGKLSIGSGIDTARSIALRADGKLIASDAYSTVMRLASNGSLDSDFGVDGRVTFDFGYAGLVAVQADGRIVMAASPNEGFNVVRLIADAQIVGSSGNDTIQVDAGVQAGMIAVSINGVVTYEGTPAGPMLIDTRGGNDTIVVNAASSGGLIIDGQGGSDTFTVNLGALGGPVEIADSGSGGTDTATINGTTGYDIIDVKNGRVTWGSPISETVTYSGMESATVDGGAGNDTITDPDSGDLTLIGGAGDDTITVQNTIGLVTVDGGAGSDHVVVQLADLQGPVNVADSGTDGTNRLSIVGTARADTINVVGDQVITGGQPVQFSAAIGLLDVDSGLGDDTVSVTSLWAPLAELQVSTGSGFDLISVGNLGVAVGTLDVAAGKGSDAVTLSYISGDVASLVVDGGVRGLSDQLTVQGDLPPEVQVINMTPVATDDSYSTFESQSVNGNALGNDINPDTSSSFVVVAVNGNGAGVGVPILTSHGTVVLNSDGSFSYTSGCASEGDSFTYVVSNGTKSATATVSIATTPYSCVNTSSGVLRVGGGVGVDTVTVSGGKLVVNGTQYSLTGVTEVRIWSHGGDDRIDLSGLTVPAFIDGGQGNDTLTGGSADDVIFGGCGDDNITGGAGNDFLIGGKGKDRIVGSAGNDILVAGDLDCGLGLAALRSISNAWATSRTVANDSVDDMLDETIGDGDSDQLTGGAGADLFIISGDDKITDFQFGKPKTNKDGDVVIKDGVATL